MQCRHAVSSCSVVMQCLVMQCQLSLQNQPTRRRHKICPPRCRRLRRRLVRTGRRFGFLRIQLSPKIWICLRNLIKHLREFHHTHMTFKHLEMRWKKNPSVFGYVITYNNFRPVSNVALLQPRSQEPENEVGTFHAPNLIQMSKILCSS